MRIESKNVKHKLSTHRMYNIWATIGQRCYNPNNPLYQRYGACGISLYDLWKNNFKAFYDWSMEHGYEDHLQIDRIDPAGNYEPDNARWVTTEQQSHNRRGKLEGATSQYKGVSWCKRNKGWRASIKFQGKMYHLGSFKDEKEAARVYNKKAAEFFGEYAHLNVIED